MDNFLAGVIADSLRLDPVSIGDANLWIPELLHLYFGSAGS